MIQQCIGLQELYPQIPEYRIYMSRHEENENENDGK